MLINVPLTELLNHAVDKLNWSETTAGIIDLPTHWCDCTEKYLKLTSKKDIATSQYSTLYI